MNAVYDMYHAEHPKSVAEQRDEARSNGELALALARLLRRRSPARQAAPGSRPSTKTR